MPDVHPTAVLGPQVRMDADVTIGPFCVLDGPVHIGAGTRLIANVHIQGPVRIGPGGLLYPCVCVGFPGQDAKFKPGDPSAGVLIGADAVLREGVTVHAATKPDRPTAVGDRVFMMANAHLGHDATVGDDVTMVNNSAVGGHGSLGDKATLGGGALVHQFTRVGRLAFAGGGMRVMADLPPFCLGVERNTLSGINAVGLRRAGMPREHITGLRRAFREVFQGRLTRAEAVGRLTDLGAQCPPVAELAEFITGTKRSLCRARGAAESADVE